VLWRAYIGPPFKRLTDPYAYDWSVNNADASATLTSISTVLSAQLLSGASTASVNTAGSFPASGGFWVGPTLNRWTWINYSRQNRHHLDRLAVEHGRRRGHHARQRQSGKTVVRDP
jgi:hypothetical protein